MTTTPQTLFIKRQLYLLKETFQLIKAGLLTGRAKPIRGKRVLEQQQIVRYGSLTNLLNIIGTCESVSQAEQMPTTVHTKDIFRLYNER